MKTAEPYNIFTSSPHIHQSEGPFFQKNGEQTFLVDSQAALQTKPFFGKQTAVPFIQGKLTIGQPGDKYEQEADAMADRVVQRLSNPETVQANPEPIINATTPLLQPQCAACDEEEQVQKQGEEDRLEDIVQRKKNFENSFPPDEEIQCKCTECEAEEKLQKNEESDSSESAGTSSLENRLNPARGDGSPLPEETRSQMESSFGADFSGVRIHTGSSAVRMNQDLHAQAFTHGSDIYFNSGKYNLESTKGKKLLAHELTHTVQQGKSTILSIQKEDEPPGSMDQPAAADPGWDPEVSLENYLQEWEDEKKAIDEEDIWGSVELSDEGPSAWIGHGAQGQRKYLLLYSEWQRLNNEQYKKEVAESFLSEENPSEAYITSLKSAFDTVSSDEQTTLNYINKQLGFEATPENFIDIEPFKSLNSANAFPRFSWAIVKKLITPPDGLVSKTNQDYEMSKRYYESYWGQLANDMYTNGLPVSYINSLGLTYYRLIRPMLVKKLDNLPDQPWMIQNYIMPSETALQSAVMQHCISAFAYFGASSVSYQVLNNWKEASAYPWLSFDTRAISDFRKEYPLGFSYLDQFYHFEYKGIAYSLGEMVVAVLLQLLGAGDQNPYKILGFKSSEAKNKAPETLNLFVQQASRDFIAQLASADGMIKQLSPEDRLLKSISWSLEKGFAGQSITILLDNLDSILLDIIKEWTKQKAIKKGVTTVVSVVGGPVGRLVSFLYNAYDTYDDVQDIVELSELVDTLVSTINDARNAQSVVQSQKSAAKLAEASVSIVPMILQILGSRLLDRLSKGVPIDKSDTLSEAKRTKLIDESSKEPDASKLEPEQVDAEVLTALKSKVYKSADAEYNAVIVLPNGHQWRRNVHGIWCRSSSTCLLPSTNSKFIQDLNKKVDSSIHEAEVLHEAPTTKPTTKEKSDLSLPVKTPKELSVGEELTVPYKKAKTRAQVVEVSDDFVKVKYKDRVEGWDDLVQSIPKEQFYKKLQDGKIIRWTEERARLMRKRPDYDEGIVDKVWEMAKDPDGKVRDPHTKQELNWDSSRSRFDQWHMGHKPGKEYAKLVDEYVNGKITYEQFLKEYNNPDNYWPENPLENVSHKHEF